MGMSVEEIVFLFTVLGLPWPPPRSVSASLHLYVGGGARYSGAERFSKCLKGAVSVPWCISRICISVCFHVWARGNLYSGVDHGSGSVCMQICSISMCLPKAACAFTTLKESKWVWPCWDTFPPVYSFEDRNFVFLFIMLSVYILPINW